MIELLVVIVVLGILAAIVIFALAGVSNQSVIAACRSDARTVNIGVGAAIAENPTTYPTSSAVWKADLLSGTALTGGPFIKTWPQSNYGYTISVAGTGASATLDNASPANGDVIVTLTSNGNAYDFTSDPSAACSTV